MWFSSFGDGYSFLFEPVCCFILVTNPGVACLFALDEYGLPHQRMCHVLH